MKSNPIRPTTKRSAKNRPTQNPHPEKEPGPTNETVATDIASVVVKERALEGWENEGGVIPNVPTPRLFT